MSIKRVLRVMEYSGPAEAVDRMIQDRYVKGTKTWNDRSLYPPYGSTGIVTVREAILGDMGEMLDVVEKLNPGEEK